MEPITLITMLVFFGVLYYEILCQLKRARRSVAVASVGGFTLVLSLAIALTWSGGSSVFLECMKLGLFQFLLLAVSSAHLAQLMQDEKENNKDTE